MSRFKTQPSFLFLAFVAVYVISAPFARAVIPVGEVVSYKEECERLLGVDKMSQKKILVDGYEILNSVPQISPDRVKEIFDRVTEIDAADPDMSDETKNILNRSFESSFYLNEILDQKFKDKKSLLLHTIRGQEGHVDITAEQAQIIYDYLIEIKKAAELSLGQELEYEVVELRALSEEKSKLNDETIWYHYDNAIVRFTVSLIGVSTFVRDGNEFYTAPSNVPLLFAADRFNDFFTQQVPVTYHGHARVKGQRMIVVGTLCPKK